MTLTLLQFVVQDNHSNLERKAVYSKRPQKQVYSDISTILNGFTVTIGN